MRIIAGALKGRVLAPVQGRTRPTAAKVREAIFNILGAAVPEAQVLDLFAGTGALGIEALSRGAARAVFVEDHPEALKAPAAQPGDPGPPGPQPGPALAGGRGLAEVGRPGRALRPGLSGPPLRGRGGGGHPEGPGRIEPALTRGLGGGGAQPPGDLAGVGRHTGPADLAALWRHPGGHLPGDG